MDDERVEALLDAAAEGVALDGLEASREADGLRLAVPGATFEGLDAATFRERAAEHGAYVANWYFWTHEVPPGEDSRAFLRWVEDAEQRPFEERLDRLSGGVVVEWGQLRIEARLADGQRDRDGASDQVSLERRYDVRHVDDADVEPDVLEAHDDPLDARQIAKHDERGRYRPLKTAPSLERGWLFPDCSADDLVTAVEHFYPGTIANWHREREGALDVDHWRPTAERQTGIYDLVDELPREAVEWVAEACCVDSQCLKRREWQFEEGDELAVDGGDGVFPCREPCSLVISAARRWTILEGESERTYELRLTKGEKRQLEELIDAVAEGRADDVREADFGDGANRYRARYFRAKRFDEDGTLGREVDSDSPEE